MVSRRGVPPTCGPQIPRHAPGFLSPRVVFTTPARNRLAARELGIPGAPERAPLRPGVSRARRDPSPGCGCGAPPERRDAARP